MNTKDKPNTSGNYLLRCMEGDQEPERVRIYERDGILRADLPSLGDYDLDSIHDNLADVSWELVTGSVVTAEMIREMEGHLPFDLLDDPPKRWQWRADYLNASLQNPGEVCACCNIARDGEIMDHLPKNTTQTQ